MSLASTSITASEQRLGASRASAAALLVGCWAIVACSSLVATFGRLPDGLSNDDAMRLVGIRDLLAGQAWFDPTQYRLGPAGSLMHWSRLIDLPIALLLKFFQLFVDAPMAERLTMAIWPLLVLLPTLAGLRALGRALQGEMAGNIALVLGMFLAPVVGHFRPGALDHHNVQIALLLWARPGPSASRGATPFSQAPRWACRWRSGWKCFPQSRCLPSAPARDGSSTASASERESIAFGLSFAGAITLLLLATVPPARWFVGACDALSVAHLAAGVVGGMGFATAGRDLQRAGGQGAADGRRLSRRCRGRRQWRLSHRSVWRTRMPACIRDCRSSGSRTSPRRKRCCGCCRPIRWRRSRSISRRSRRWCCRCRLR